MLSPSGFPVVLAAPSGAGKTTIAKALVGRDPRFSFSVSVTTRAARPGEREGVDYHFVDRSAFERMIAAGDLCEWAEVHGNLYGTPFANLESGSLRGGHVVLDIDVQGARQIRQRVKEAVLVFIFPPSAEALLGRLTGRKTEGLEEVARRLRNARKELAAAKEFDYVVVNDELESAVRQVREIVRAEGHRPDRSHLLEENVERLQTSIDRILQGGFEKTGAESRCSGRDNRRSSRSSRERTGCASATPCSARRSISRPRRGSASPSTSATVATAPPTSSPCSAPACGPSPSSAVPEDEGSALTPGSRVSRVSAPKTRVRRRRTRIRRRR